jgi:FtsZ-binding cell division protein ZapB
MSLQQHPLSAAFPSMPEVDLEALAEDIKKHGQRDDGVMYEGMVLDGWHRYLACEKAGVKFFALQFDGDDPVAFVLGKNLHRRHMTGSQRAAAVVAATNWRPRGDQKSRSAPGADRTAKQLAEQAEVSERTIEHAKAAEKAGLGDVVREGVVSAKRAAEIAKLPRAKREKALTEKPKVIKASKDFEQLYDAVKAELAETKEALATLADTAASVEVFKNDEQFKAMQILREEMRSVKRRRDELMRENAELKKQVSHWKKKAEKK